MGPRIEPLPDRGNGHRRILLGGKIDQPNLRAVFWTIHQLRVGFDGQLDQLKGYFDADPFVGKSVQSLIRCFPGLFAFHRKCVPESGQFNQLFLFDLEGFPK